MAPSSGSPSVRWYRSFYLRIGFGFVVFVVGLFVAQGVIFRILLAEPPFPGRSPNNVVAILAADLGSALVQDRGLDVDAYLKREYARLQPAYVLMKNGQIASNRSAPLTEGIQRSVEGVLAGRNLSRSGTEPALGGTPFVMAPIQVGNELRGIVVLPPAPQPSPIARDVRPLVSMPGTALLIVATVLVAAFIFEPSRRRLKALQDASRRLGSGDLTARAPGGGGDELGEVAAAFNKMAADLAARDDALRTSDRLRRQMLADVSHELKTPLTAMRGYVETLHMADVTLDHETRERYFRTLERETVRLDRIVKDLVDLARFENGVGELAIRDFAIRRLFDHVVQRHEHEIGNRQLSVGVDVSEAADQILADPDRIEQAIENLFANALRHTPPGGTLTLSARVENHAAVLSVIDSGSGIPQEHVAHVFDRFYKVDSARPNESNGSGLGLSIVKAIVDRHGGRIDVESEPGRTAFTIALPLAGRAAEAASQSTAQSTSTNL